MIRFCSLLLLTLALSGCKLLLIVTNGGSVSAPVSATTCVALTNCEFDIVDSTFVENFEAIPDSGYQFLEWYDAPNFLCAGSTNPLCSVSSAPLAGIFPDAVIASSPNVYMMAVFTDKAPIRDTVSAADGNEWAQPVLFTGLTWAEIESVCPLFSGGVCNGSLNGWDMNGWVWANAPTIDTLFNSYGVTPPLDYLTNPFSTGCNTSWFSAFSSDNWLPTATFTGVPFFMSGFVAEPPISANAMRAPKVSRGNTGACTPSPGDTVSQIPINSTINSSDPANGAYFLRTP